MVRAAPLPLGSLAFGNNLASSRRALLGRFVSRAASPPPSISIPKIPERLSSWRTLAGGDGAPIVTPCPAWLIRSSWSTPRRTNSSSGSWSNREPIPYSTAARCLQSRAPSGQEQDRENSLEVGKSPVCGRQSTSMTPLESLPVRSSTRESILPEHSCTTGFHLSLGRGPIFTFAA